MHFDLLCFPESINWHFKEILKLYFQELKLETIVLVTQWKNNLNESNPNQRVCHEYQILKTLPTVSGEIAWKAETLLSVGGIARGIIYAITWFEAYSQLCSDPLTSWLRPNQQFSSVSSKRRDLNNQIPRRFRQTSILRGKNQWSSINLCNPCDLKLSGCIYMAGQKKSCKCKVPHN